MSKYYIKFCNANSAKNKAQEEAKGYAERLDSMLLPDEHSKNKFIKEVQNRIDSINKEYKRCGDVKVDVWTTDGIQHICLADGICYIRIFKVKIDVSIG